MSVVNSKMVEDLIRKSITDVHYLRVIDTSDGCGYKFEVIVVSDSFNGVPLLKRHRMVTGALSVALKTIHALSLKTWTLEQYQKKTDAE